MHCHYGVKCIPVVVPLLFPVRCLLLVGVMWFQVQCYEKKKCLDEVVTVFLFEMSLRCSFAVIIGRGGGGNCDEGCFSVKETRKLVVFVFQFSNSEESPCSMSQRCSFNSL